MVSGQFDKDDLAKRLTGAIGDITGLWDQDNPDLLYLTAEAAIGKAVSVGRDLLPNSPSDAVNKFIDLDVRMNQRSQLGMMRDGYRAFAETVSDFSHLRANSELLSEYSALGRWYVVVGTMLAIHTGVRGVSDAGAEYDAVDGHKQGLLERWTDGATGTIQLGADWLRRVGWAKGLGGLRTPKGLGSGVLKGDSAAMEFGFKWTRRGPRVVSHRWKWSSEALKAEFKASPEAWKAVRRHEAMHLLDARRHPFAAWYSQRGLPAGSVVRYILEYRGWRAEYLQRGLTPSMTAPLRSMSRMQIGMDVAYGILGGLIIYDLVIDGGGQDDGGQ